MIVTSYFYHCIQELLYIYCIDIQTDTQLEVDRWRVLGGAMWYYMWQSSMVLRTAELGLAPHSGAVRG